MLTTDNPIHCTMRANPKIIWHGCDSVNQTNAIYSNKLLQLTTNYTGWLIQCFDNQEEDLAGQKLSHEVLAWWLPAVRCRRFAYGPADATATPLSLASLKSRLLLTFWCRLTQAVLEKRPVNGHLLWIRSHSYKKMCVLKTECSWQWNYQTIEWSEVKWVGFNVPLNTL